MNAYMNNIIFGGHPSVYGYFSEI